MSLGRKPAWVAGWVAAVFLGGAIAALGATNVLVLAITEGPDPVAQILWLPASLVGQVDPLKDDGRPDVAYAGSQITVVWATLVAGGYDIALDRWSGSKWEPKQMLTVGGPNEVDPRVSVDGAATRVVWWLGASEAVQLLTSQGPTWGAPEYVTPPGATGRRPSVALAGTAELVSFERGAAGQVQQIVLATRETGGTFVEQVLFSVLRTKPLDAKLHVEKGHLWIEWKHSDSQFAFSERIGGSWSAPVTVAWSDPTWAGEERTRAFIRGQVLAP